MIDKKKMNRVIIVGGGAAGLMAAGQAAGQGTETLLLEKMNRPGRKLRITGKGRCNLTNLEDIEDFIAHFGPNGRFLRQAFSCFFSRELRLFFKELGVNTLVERGGRVFPAEGNAANVVDSLLKWVREIKVGIETGTRVRRVLVKDGEVCGVSVLKRSQKGLGQVQEKIYKAERIIISTGGASYPATGSTGDGYDFARALGHEIIPIRPSLVPLETRGDIAARLERLRLKNVGVRLVINGKRRAKAFGEMVFTDYGVSGPVILTLSRVAVDSILKGDSLTLCIDLKPALDDQKLDNRLIRDFNRFGKRRFVNILKGILPNKLIPVCIEQTDIPEYKLGHRITASERKRLCTWLKRFELHISNYRPFSEAIITAGGVNINEINPRSMESRLIKGLYFAGEIIDLDGDTGGYNLQAAFSTGWLAGRSAVF